MSKDPNPRDLSALEERQLEILKSVIQAHVITGEPVGSRTLSQGSGLDLSPATIRNVMSDLEERGLLLQPHASAGRVPTDRAYRLYVDHLMGQARLQAGQAQEIDLALEHRRGEIPELLAEAARQLSRVSQHVGVVLTPEMRRVVVDRLEFIGLDPRRVVAILIDRSGVVHNRILHVFEPFDQADLDLMGRELSVRFGGKPLSEIREAIAREITEERAQVDRLRARLLKLGADAFSLERDGKDVLVEGASNLLGAPEFGDLDRTKSLLKTLEQKGRLVDLLERVLGDEGVQVVIGHENPESSLADLSFVAASYRTGDRVLGTVGIVGPTRMEYARAIALVDYLAHLLTRFLTHPGA
ncbi:MAG TPA: heat-inducible transcriptional repressor HrcA [Candidatus Polarisedimenticolaceae bacterium]|nr:heat-inducible transcriptional repressor HrcA [Candidatus Polarisedimenticolaceae bacterium]